MAHDHHAAAGSVNVGSLFSGAGLMDWGLTLAGFDHAWFCESDPYCRRVLERRWPGVPIFEDVRTLEAPARVSLLSGGFPCQDISAAGRRAGITGERSGLWAHFARLVDELRPEYVLVENVADLLKRGMGRVLGDLADVGYDAEWDCLPAAAFGAPHLRARIFILAYPRSGGRPEDHLQAGWDPAWGGGTTGTVADSNGERRTEGLLERTWREELARTRDAFGSGERDVQDAHSGTFQPRRLRWRAPRSGSARWWASEPDVGRVADGVADRLDRLSALGNGVVPQISWWLGQRILEREAIKDAA